ncbi:MAG TPA: T9SS type A sorting domain-containing protein, partial [Salinivirgaceae bacterium]|nr:T9SS type A sorting domain-containing protein [Salinivirgaceae bacterium]
VYIIVLHKISKDLSVLDSLHVSTSIARGINVATSKLGMFSDGTLMYVLSVFELENVSNTNGIYIVSTKTDFSSYDLVYHPSAYPISLFGTTVEGFLPYQNSDTAFVFTPFRPYLVDNHGQKIDSFPCSFYKPLGSMEGVVRPLGATWINNRLVLGGSKCHVIAKYNDTLGIEELFSLCGFGCSGNTAHYEPISKYGDNLFIGGTDKLSGSSIYGTESTLMLYKLDSELNVVWNGEYKNKDGFYYYAFSVFATSDGGCIIAATKNNITTLGYNLLGYVLKVDSLGNAPNTNIENVATISQLYVYPNPGVSTINVFSGKNCTGGIFRMYNSTGVLVLQSRLHNETETVDISNLPTGIYIYEIHNQSGAVERGKWVKSN